MSNLFFTELQNHSVVNRLNSLLIFDCKRGDGSDSIQGGGGIQHIWSRMRHYISTLIQVLSASTFGDQYS